MAAKGPGFKATIDQRELEDLVEEIAKRVYRKVARLMKRQLRELHDPDEEDWDD